MEVDGSRRIDPVIELVEIGQFAGASREQLLKLTKWLAPQLRPVMGEGMAAAQRDLNPLAWAPARLSRERVEFDTSGLDKNVKRHGNLQLTTQGGQTNIERDGILIGVVHQGRFRLLEEECQARDISIEHLCACVPEWIAHVEKHEAKRGFGSQQFWNGLREALGLDGIIGCCPLMAPSSFQYSSWNGVSAEWGFQLRPCRPIFDLLRYSPDEQRSLLGRLRQDQVWFALTRRSTLGRNLEQELHREGQVITVYKRGSRVAASKHSFKTGILKANKSMENWTLWGSKAALGVSGEVRVREGHGGEWDRAHLHLQETAAGISGGTGDPAETERVLAGLRKRGERVRALKERADSIRLTADGVIPLNMACPSSREALLGQAGAAYQRSGIVVATDGSLRRSGIMGAAMVAKDNRLPARSVAVFGPPSSGRAELTAVVLALVNCPREEDLNILTDSLGSMQRLQSMQREDFPLFLYRHPTRQLLLHAVDLINQRAAAGSTTRLIKVRAHRGEPLNEWADSLAAGAAELDPARSVSLDQDPEAVYFLVKETWVEWDHRIREDMIQRAAERCVTRILQQKGWQPPEISPSTMPLTASWLLRPDHGRQTLGRVLGEMPISAAKKQVLQSVAGAFPGNAVLHKWGIVPSAACALCGHPAETQSHIQCRCPALKEARIRAHHNMARKLWRGIEGATKGWIIVTEQTVAGLMGMQQPPERVDEWQRAWDELTDVHLEGEEAPAPDDTDAATLRKRPDAWAVSWKQRHLLIMEFTRPNDRCALSLQDTDRFKTARYTPLRDRLTELLPGWRVDIQTYTVGIRGSHDPNRWQANLQRLGMTASRAERLVREMVSQALTELTDLYSVRYAALRRLENARQDEP